MSKKRFWCRDVVKTGTYCLEHFPERAKQAIERADEICENVFLFTDHWEMERTQEPVQFPGEIDWTHIPFGDEEWVYALNRHTCFVNLGKAYHYTKDEKYARQFVKLVRDWIARVPLTPESEGNTWRSLEAGLRCENWLRAMRLFEGSATFTPELRQTMEDTLRIHMDYLIRKSGTFQKLSNWGVLQDHGLLLLALYFDTPETAELAARRLDDELHLQTFRDGSHWEQSPMYHCEVLHCCLDAVWIARQNGFSLPTRFVKNTWKLCKGLAAWLKPDGRLICQSDSDDTDARDLLTMGALLFHDGLLKFAARGKFFEETLWDFGEEGVADYVSLQPITPESISTALPDSGNYILRSDLEEDAVWLHMHCGCLGSGHGHADLLHIDVGAFGEDILIDSGRYTYVNTPLRRALKLPAAHNTTRVDGMDFSTCVDSWAYGALANPLKGEYCFTKEADYISGMHMGYWNLPQGGVLTGRKVFFVKPGVFAVFDQFYGNGAHTYEQFFHFGAGTLTTDGHTAQWKGEKACACLHFLGDVTVEQQTAPYSRDYNALCQGDAVSISRSGEGFCSFISIIAVEKAEVGYPALTAEMLPVRKVLAQKTLPDASAQALKLCVDGQEIVLLAVHGEIISGVDLLEVGGYEGYGKAIVFTSKMQQGTCLAW